MFLVREEGSIYHTGSHKGITKICFGRKKGCRLIIGFIPSLYRKEKDRKIDKNNLIKFKKA